MVEQCLYVALLTECHILGLQAALPLITGGAYNSAVQGNTAREKRPTNRAMRRRHGVASSSSELRHETWLLFGTPRHPKLSSAHRNGRPHSTHTFSSIRRG